MYKILKIFLVVLMPVMAMAFINGHLRENNSPSGTSTNRSSLNADTRRADIVCLIYHRFGDSRYPSTNISTQLFNTQLQYLKDHRFNVITFGQAVKLMSSHEDIPDKTVVITIDDGFYSFRENAFPLLNKFGYKATLFINTKTVGAGDYMDWQDLKDLVRNGFEIGNHSHSHDYFLNQKEDRVEFFRNDVMQCQKLLKDSLGISPVIFAYPYGEFDRELKESIQSMGFSAAAAQNSGVFCESSDLYSIPRFPINDQYGNITMFIEKVNMKAIRIINSGELSPLYDKNPPVLNITIPDGEYDLNRMQGFIQHGEPKLDIKTDDKVNIRLVSNRKLSDRRVLYTITVPGKDNDHWYWFSHVWINPGIKE